MRTWNITTNLGKKVLTTAGNLVVDISDWDEDISLAAYEKYCLALDIANHRHYRECDHCNRLIQCYNNYKGFVLCEKCVSVQHLAVTAENINNVWFDFLAEIVNPKLKR